MSREIAKFDKRITKDAAQALQNEPRNRFLLWTIYVRPKDFPDKVIVRPHIADETYGPLPYHIEANSVEEARAMLPSGLHYLGRDKRDDPAIYEVWI